MELAKFIKTRIISTCTKKLFSYFIKKFQR